MDHDSYLRMINAITTLGEALLNLSRRVDEQNQRLERICMLYGYTPPASNVVKFERKE